jgi:hypothetical protein
MCFEIRQINITIDCSKINNLKIRRLQLIIPESHKKKGINGHSLQRRKYNLHTCIMQQTFFLQYPSASPAPDIVNYFLKLILNTPGYSMVGCNTCTPVKAEIIWSEEK